MSKTNKPSSSQRTENQNYFAPLQTIDNDDDEIVIDDIAKEKVPPLTILKCQTEQVHEIMRLLKITDYSIKKMSIGLKVFCTNKVDYDNVCNSLDRNFDFEYFTYASKKDKPYEAVLLGLDKCNPEIIKKDLLDKGLKCIEVKIVTRVKQNRGENIIFYCLFRKKINFNKRTETKLLFNKLYKG